MGSGKDTVAKIIQYLIYTKKQNIELDVDFILSCLPDKNIDENLLVIRSSWTIKKFAGKLKEIVALLTGCRVEDLEDQEFKKQFLGKEWDRTFYKIGDGKTEFDDLDSFTKSTSYREILQWVGTDAMRDKVHPNIWVNALFSDYRKNMQKSSSYEDAKNLSFPKWIITDMRFPNEMQAVKDRGGITIRIHRDTFFRTGDFSVSTHPSETALDESKFDYEIENNGTIEELIKKVKEILIDEKII